jgi:hypothetical protein
VTSGRDHGEPPRHQHHRRYRLRFELGRELGPFEEARRTAAEVNGLSAVPLAVQRQAKGLRQETERLLAVSMRLHGQPNREG